MYRVGICDDDGVFCRELETLIASYAKQEGIGISTDIFSSGEALLDILEKEKSPLQMLFLDIEMDGIDGIFIGQWIRRRIEYESTQIVFVSVKESYALKLFQIQPFDFLIKPVSKERVFHVLGEYKRLFVERNVFFTYRMGKSSYSISEDEIRYFKCEGKKISLVTRMGEREFYGKMSDLPKQVSGDKFCAIHKSYMVNMNYVQAFLPDEVVMDTGERLPVSQSHRKAVRQAVLWWNRLGRYP